MFQVYTYKIMVATNPSMVFVNLSENSSSILQQNKTQQFYLAVVTVSVSKTVSLFYNHQPASYQNLTEEHKTKTLEPGLKIMSKTTGLQYRSILNIHSTIL